MSGPGAPLNFLLITFDQWRADSWSGAGHPLVRTPNIDALARRGTCFSAHHTVTTPCGPARASLLTGLYLHNHRVVRNDAPLDSRHLTLAQALRRAGYRPRLFGFTDTILDPRGSEWKPGATGVSMAPGFEEGLHLPGDSWPWLEWLEGRGHKRPARARDIWLPAARRERIDSSATRYAALESESRFITDAAIAYIESQAFEPWFVHLSYFRPHHPYIAPAPFNALYAADDVPAPVRREELRLEMEQHPFLRALAERQQAGRAPVQDEHSMAALDSREIAQLRANYYGSIAELDQMIGALLATLEKSGQSDRTYIILTSDHGDMLGDHWLWAAEGYFDQAFHVPLIVSDPRPVADGGRGRRVTRFTESVDIMPTLCRAAGAEAPRCDGRDLSPFLTGDLVGTWRSGAVAEVDFRDTAVEGLQSDLGLAPCEANFAFLRTDRLKYVHFAALPPILFNLREDPRELVNRAEDPACRSSREECAARLLDWRMKSDGEPLYGPGPAT